jgi:hypothetical protein
LDLHRSTAGWHSKEDPGVFSLHSPGRGHVVYLLDIIESIQLLLTVSDVKILGLPIGIGNPESYDISDANTATIAD